MMEHPKLKELQCKLAGIYHLRNISSLLSWDQSVYMPEGGAKERGEQLAFLAGLMHERQTDPEIGKLLDQLEKEKFEDGSDEAQLIKVTRRTYERTRKIPNDFNSEFENHVSKVYNAWIKARPDNNFGAVKDLLKKSVDLTRRTAEYYPGYDHIMDPLIDRDDEGMTQKIVMGLFDTLRGELVPLVDQVLSQESPSDACLKQPFPQSEQRAFGEAMIREMGYDFKRGRQDLTHHPFMVKFAMGDVRITTRFKDEDFSEGFFSTVHEAGHALYEQGLREELGYSPLCGGTSSGVHESQSRLWENVVARSDGYWTHAFPKLQKHFPNQFGSVKKDEFYRAINKVSRSLIRTDSDELTYNLHVMIRFGLESDLLEGKISVDELPEEWNARYERDLGVRPDSDANGVLQDVHWYVDRVGGTFQGYTIGNILAAQFFDAACKAHPEIPTDISNGTFSPLREWLRKEVHSHGSKFMTEELVERSCGGPMSVEPYLNYLKKKYGELYSL